MAEIIWSERAIKDLEQIGDYISNDSVRYAKIVIQKLFNKLLKNLNQLLCKPNQIF